MAEHLCLPVLLLDGVGIGAPSLEALKDHAASVFASVGVRLAWRDGEDPDPGWRLEDGIKAVLFARAPVGWNLPKAAMGTAFGKASSVKTVFVFHETTRAFAVGPPPAQWSPQQEGRALGRVLAHELVHALAPQLPHASAGLMAPRLRSSHLLAPRIQLDDASAEALRQGVLQLGDPPARSHPRRQAGESLGDLGPQASAAESLTSRIPPPGSRRCR